MKWLYILLFCVSLFPTLRYLQNLIKRIKFYNALDCFISSLFFLLFWFCTYKYLEVTGFEVIIRSTINATALLLLIYFHYYLFGGIFGTLIAALGLIELILFLTNKYLSKPCKKLDKRLMCTRLYIFIQRYYLPSGENSTILTTTLMRRIILFALVLSGIILVSPVANTILNLQDKLSAIQNYGNFAEDISFYKDALIITIISTAIGGFINKESKE